MKKKNFQKNPRQIVQGLTAVAMLFLTAQGHAQVVNSTSGTIGGTSIINTSGQIKTTGQVQAGTAAITGQIQAESIVVSGQISGGSYGGDGSGFTKLNPASIGAGNILRNTTTTGILSLQVGAVSSTAFTGDGQGIIRLNASNISTGTIGSGITINTNQPITTTLAIKGNSILAESSTGVRGSITGAAITGTTITGTSFVGNGAGITALNASNITTGTIGGSIPINTTGAITSGAVLKGNSILAESATGVRGSITGAAITGTTITGTNFVGNGSGLTGINATLAANAVINTTGAITSTANITGKDVYADGLYIKDPGATTHILKNMRFLNSSTQNLPAADGGASFTAFKFLMATSNGAHIEYAGDALRFLRKTGTNAKFIWENQTKSLMTLDPNDNKLNVAGEVTATAFVGDGSKLTGIAINPTTIINTTTPITTTATVKAGFFEGDGSKLLKLPLPAGLTRPQVGKLSILDDAVEFAKDVIFGGPNLNISGTINLGSNSEVSSPLRVKGNAVSELRLRATSTATPTVHSAVFKSNFNNGQPYVSIGIDNNTELFRINNNVSTFNTPLAINGNSVGLLVSTMPAGGNFEPHGIIRTETRNPLILGAGNNNRILIDYFGPVSIIGFGESFPIISSEVETSFGLTVTRGVISEDVAIAKKTDWADYVFAKDYKLTSLEDLEVFIQKNKHLPEITSQSKIKEKGFYQVHDVIVGQLKNLEEQVLHNISQEKKLKLQQDQLKEQAIKIAEQQAQLDRLEAMLNQFINK